MDLARTTNSPPADTRPPLVAPVLVWILVSLSALLLAATETPLWARVSPPTEQFALATMFVVQLTMVSLLFPWLLADGRAAAMVILGSALLLQLAGLLGDTPSRQVGQSILWLWMWQGSFWLVLRGLHTRRAQQIGVAIGTTAAIGGMVLMYLRGEFGPDGKVGDPAILWLGSGVVLAGATINYFLRSRQETHH